MILFMVVIIMMVMVIMVMKDDGDNIVHGDYDDSNHSSW